jgi:ELWxxDGT repeat protein
VKDIDTGGLGSSPVFLTPFAGKLFFRATQGGPSGSGVELWVTDGTSTGTTIVKDINPSGNSDPSGLIVAGSNLYFTAYDGVNGIELWKTDGTTAGTVIVKNIRSTVNSSNPSNFRVVGDTLYFAASDGKNGNELWKTDATGATIMVKDINTTADEDSNPGSLVSIGSTLYSWSRASMAAAPGPSRRS